MSIVRLVDVNDIIGRIREERRGRLLVQVSAVDDKDGLLNGWDLQEIASYLVRGQGLTWSGRMPDIARLLATRGFLYSLDGMDLVGTQKDEGFLAIVDDRVLHDHLVGPRDGEDLMGKAVEIDHGLVVLVHPLGQELLI